MLEFALSRLKKITRAVDMRIQRNKYGYIDKLPEDIKYPEGGLYDAIYESSKKWPHNIAITYYNYDVTYKELIKKINRVAKALKHIGVEKSDTVSICMPNTPEAV